MRGYYLRVYGEIRNIILKLLSKQHYSETWLTNLLFMHLKHTAITDDLYLVLNLVWKPGISL